MTSFSKTLTADRKPIISELIGKNGFAAYRTAYGSSSTVINAAWFSASDNFGAKSDGNVENVHVTFDASTGEILVYHGDYPDVSSRWGYWGGTYTFCTW